MEGGIMQALNISGYENRNFIYKVITLIRNGKLHIQFNVQLLKYFTQISADVWHTAGNLFSGC